MMIRIFTICLALLVASLMLAQAQGQGPVDGAEYLVCDRDAAGKLAPGWQNRFPSYTTVAIVFRDAKEQTDPDNAKWPTFFYGRPSGEGRIVWSQQQPQANFTVKAEAVVQGQGDQSRRVAGGLVQDGQFTPISLQVRAFGTAQAETVTEKDRSGRDVTKTVLSYPVDAVLTVGQRAIPVQARAAVRFPAPGEGTDRQALYVNMTFAVTGTELGLPNPPADPIQCRISVTAFPKEKP